MGVTAHLVFDPASLAESANVGAFVRAGDDGAVIGHVSDALKVNISNTSVVVSATALDIRALTNADVVTVEQGTSPWVIGDGGGSITVDGTVAATQSGTWTVDAVQSGSWTVAVSGSVAVTATNLDIRDLTAASDSVASWLFDGTGNAIGSTSGAINVHLTGSNTITVNDAALADTAGSNAAVSVGTSSISLAASILANRKYLFAFNNDKKAMYLGFGTVTSANGYPMFPGQAYEFRAGPALDMKVISTAAAQDARIMQLS